MVALQLNPQCEQCQDLHLAKVWWEWLQLHSLQKYFPDPPSLFVRTGMCPLEQQKSPLLAIRIGLVAFF